jgi:histone acetyltransferase 1
MHILVPLFIEGGTLIDFKDPALDRWTVFFLYRKKTVEAESKTSPYIFMGYSTVYRYFYFQADRKYIVNGERQPIKADSNFQLSEAGDAPNTFSCRSRISQFIILPPFQRGGHGSRFYNSIFDFLHKDPLTIEITLEDPNEAFDDMRDINDLIRLRKLPGFTSVIINTHVKPRAKGPAPNNIIDMDKLEKIRIQAKIAPRQFYRVCEMQALSLIPATIRQSLIIERTKIPDLKVREHEYALWKLWVKKRLYRHNKDMLIQLDRSERIEKLEQALGSVEADYARLLRALDKRQNGSSNGTNSSLEKAEVSVAENEGEPSAKRVKFS